MPYSSSEVADVSLNILMMWNSTSVPLAADLNISHHHVPNATNRFPGPPRGRPGPPPGRDSFMTTMTTVQYYGDPIIFVVGMLGNLLTYLVFTRSRFRKVPSVPYLSGIAVADSGFLFTYFLNSLTYVYNLPIMSQMGVCQFGMFANYVCLFLSMWYSVAVVVEKFISVYWPLKKVSLCTVFRAKVVLVSIAVLAIVSYSYVIYFFGPEKRFGLCNPWREFQEPYQVLMVLDCIVVFIAPLLVISALVLLVIIRGCEYYRISSASDFGPRANSSSSSSQTTLRPTEMIFSLVALILITHFPNSVVRIIGFFTKTMGMEDRMKFMKSSSVVRQIHLTSFAVKFLVYLFVSRSFRKHTKNLLCSGKDRVVSLCDCDTSSEADPQRISLKGCGGQGQPVANACLIQSDV